MTDQADMEARAWNMLCERLQRDPAASEESDTCSLRAAWKAMLSYAAEREAAAYARAAEVARNAWVPSYVRGDLSDPEKWEPGSPWDRGAVDACNRIATEIEALGEAKG